VRSKAIIIIIVINTECPRSVAHKKISISNYFAVKFMQIVCTQCSLTEHRMVTYAKKSDEIYM